MVRIIRPSSVFFLLCLCFPVRAEADVNYPSRTYYAGLEAYHDGDYRGALRAFESALRSGMRSPEGRWVDSICYYTMMGECYYQMGRHREALEQYEAALQLALFQNNWMNRVQYPDLEPSASTVRNTIQWGVSQRNAALARLPRRMGTLVGQTPEETEQAVTQGGIVALPQIFPLDVREVARTTAVAIRRRHQLTGPVGRHTPMTSRLLAALGSRPTLPNHWSQAWIRCQLGLAYAAAGKTDQAISELKQSLLLGGQYDHDLTAIALVTLGDLAFKQGRMEQAATYYLEATFTAAALEQYDLMQEAFEGGLTVHRVTGQEGPYAPLPAARSWAQRNSRALEAWLAILSAEDAAHVGKAREAGQLLAQARKTIGNRDMRSGRIGGRFEYIAALVDFQNGNLIAGNRSLKTALDFQQASSPWLLQIALADNLYTSGEITQRVADDLYSHLLREPQSSDWLTQPLDTLSVITTPRPGPLRRWFEVAKLRKDSEKVFHVAEQLRRQRFFSTLPMGGRMLALRWVMEAPEASLSPEALLQRQDIRARYPEYAELAARAREIQRRLRDLPPVPESNEQRREQSQLLEQLEEVSAAQEWKLSSIALRREAAEFVFPPLMALEEVQARMPAGQLMLAYVAQGPQVTAMAIDSERIALWEVESPETLGKRISELLGKIGAINRRVPVDVDRLHDSSWHAESRDLLQQLTNVREPSLWDSYEEVVIVPDGMLWYVPFEALHVTSGDGGEPLIARVPVRYAPTASLANLPGPGLPPRAATAVVAGQLLTGEDPNRAVQASDEIAQSLPGTVRLTESLPASTPLFATTLDRLIVLNEIDVRSNSPYGWNPFSDARGRSGGDLASWFALPWKRPQQIVLPGYLPPSPSNLASTNGAEIFLPLCGLMATGTRSILISRWALGGQSAFDLVREYAQELPYVSPSNAWRRSVLLNSHSQIAPSLEPRLRLNGTGDSIPASHPVFWAGYLLVDSGTQPAHDP